MINEVPRSTITPKEMGPLEQFKFVNGEVISNLLTPYGREPHLRGLYLRDDHSMAVGVAEVSPMHCAVTNPVWRRQQLEMMDETAVLLRELGNENGGRVHSQVGQLGNFSFRNMVPEAENGRDTAVVNIIARHVSNDHEAAKTDAQISFGENNIISSGTMVHDSNRRKTLQGGLVVPPEARKIGYELKKDKIAEVLKKYGYDASAGIIDEVFLTRIGAVARVSIDQHAAVKQSISPWDEIEAMIQTIILKSHLGQASPGEAASFFTRIDNFSFFDHVKAPASLTVRVDQLFGNAFTGMGTLYCGEESVATGQIRMSSVPVKAAKTMADIDERKQRNRTPLFPLQP